MRRILGAALLALSLTGCGVIRPESVIFPALGLGYQVAEHSNELVCALAGGACQMDAYDDPDDVQ